MRRRGFIRVLAAIADGEEADAAHTPWMASITDDTDVVMAGVLALRAWIDRTIRRMG